MRSVHCLAICALLLLSACRNFDDLETVHLESRPAAKEVTAEWRKAMDQYYWQTYWIRYRGYYGPEPPQPTVRMPSDEEVTNAVLRQMEMRLVALLRAHCPDQSYDCLIAELKRLEFSCVDTADGAACEQVKDSRTELYCPLKCAAPTRHRWAVQVHRHERGAALATQVEYISPWPSLPGK